MHKYFLIIVCNLTCKNIKDSVTIFIYQFISILIEKYKTKIQILIIFYVNNIFFLIL